MKSYLLLFLGILLFASVKAQRSPKEDYDVFPRFSENSGDFNSYIADHVKKPEIISGDEKGTIGITVLVDSNGRSSVLNITQKLSAEVNNEFVKAITAAPKWTPAKLKHKAINYYFTTFFDVDVSKGSSIMNVEVHGSPRQSTNIKDLVFTAVQVEPGFPGGEKKLQQFLSDNLKYPPLAKQNGIMGVAYLQFIVETDGSLSNIKIIRDPGSGLGDEAVRVMKLSPKWTPGKQNGVTVRVQYTLPVRFSL